jgi:hypothetical protein
MPISGDGLGPGLQPAALELNEADVAPGSGDDGVDVRVGVQRLVVTVDPREERVVPRPAMIQRNVTPQIR